MIGRGDDQARARAASALSELCQLSDQNKQTVVGAGAIPLHLREEAGQRKLFMSQGLRV